MQPTDGPDMPIDLETLLASIVEVLKQRGGAREIGIILAAKAEAYVSNYDNWNGGTYAWGIRFALDLRDFGSLTEKDREDAEKIICDAGNQFFIPFENDGLGPITIVTEPVQNPAWRKEGNAFIAGRGINAQARAAELVDHAPSAMVEIDTLVLDYRRGGASDLHVREPLDEAVSRSTIESARMLLVARNEDDALALVAARDFALYSGTNGFGDDFLAVFAWVSPVRCAKYRKSMASDPRLKRAAVALRDAVASANRDAREVRFVAVGVAENIVHGEHGEYRFEEEFDRGGFATIHRARDDAGDLVAFKRLYVRDDEAVGRLRREIQEQKRIVHSAVMPVLDHDPSYRWFVMPMATENLAQCWADRRLDEGLLINVLRAAISGLNAAHELGLVHRDVSPRNILLVGKQWVVADWGVVRRPRGLTTMVRTQGELGTNGFAAPELFRDAHAAGAPADVYALGRIAAWAILRTWPEQNVASLPDGPWRQFVRRATEHEEGRRPQTMTELAGLLDQVEEELTAFASVPGETLPRFATMSPDDVGEADACLEHCLAHRDDHNVYLDNLPQVPATALRPWIEGRTDDLATVVRALEAHVLNDAAWAARDVDESNKPIAWLRRVAEGAAQKAKLGLLEDAAVALMRAEADWKRFAQRHRTRAWLEALQGEPARTVARVLAREPAAVEWLTDEGWSPAHTALELRAQLERR